MLLIFALHTNGQKNSFIQGYIFDYVSQEPLPYVNIMNLTDNHSGTTSQRNGFFQLPINQSTSKTIQINSFGYQDTTIIVRNVDEDLKIFLIPNTQTLPAYTIQASKLKRKSIGSKKQRIRKINEQYVGFSGIPGWSNGVFLQPRGNKKTITLQSVDFFIADNGPLLSAFQVRILIPKQPIKPNKLLGFSSFIDANPEIITHRVLHRGWNSINLEDSNITIPRIGFVVLFSPIMEGEEFFWLNKTGVTSYGATIAFYESENIPNMNWVNTPMGKINIVKQKGPGSANPVPAIVINYWE